MVLRDQRFVSTETPPVRPLNPIRVSVDRSTPSGCGRRQRCRAAYRDPLVDHGPPSSLQVSAYGRGVLAALVLVLALPVAGAAQTSSLPTVSVFNDEGVVEGDALEFTVSLSAPSSVPVTVQYRTMGSSASPSGTDFTAAAGTLTFVANETSKTVSVQTTDDTEAERDGWLYLILSNPTNATLGVPRATGAIRDDDSARVQEGVWQVGIVPDQFHSAIEGNEIEFEVWITGGTAENLPVTVQYATSSVNAESTDYTAASGTLTFGANETVKTVRVSTTHDTVDEGNELIRLTLSNPTNATLAYGSQGEATGTIVDNDIPTVSVSDASATEGDAVEFTVSLSGEPRPGDTSVYYDFEYGSADSSDFTLLQSGSIEFVPGTMSMPVRVSTTDDVTDEENETFSIRLYRGPCPCSWTWRLQLGDATATGTIIDNDGNSPTVSVSDASATEGDAVEFTVSLSAESAQQVTVEYATSGGTAESGTDFTAASGSLTFGANETSKTVSVATTDDSVDEESETLTLTLSSPTNATLGDPTATGTINDDDGSPALTARFESMPSLHDGANAFTFELAFSEELPLSYVTLRDEAFDVTGGTVRKAGRQERGSNLRWTITVAPNTNSAVTIELPATQDCNASGAICTDDNRPLSHSLSATVAGPTPTVSVSDASATEGDAVEFTVSLSAASAQQVTVEYATSGGTAESGTDFTAASGSLTFGANETSKTVSVATTNDSVDEEDETFTLTLSSPTNATLGDATVTGTINDDDESLPTASVSDASASEGDAVEFTVSPGALCVLAWSGTRRSTSPTSWAAK